MVINSQLDVFSMQRDHVRIAVKDAVSRYTPAVPQECYKVSWDCVLEETEFKHLHKCCKLHCINESELFRVNF